MWSVNHSRVYIQMKWNQYLEDLNSHVYCSILHDSQDIGKKTKCPSMNECIKKMWHIYTHTYVIYHICNIIHTHTHTLEDEMATHSSILAWKILWTEEPGRLVAKNQTWLSDWPHTHIHTHTQYNIIPPSVKWNKPDKDKYHMVITYMWRRKEVGKRPRIKEREGKQANFTETENRTVVAKGCGGGRDKEIKRSKGTTFQLQESVLRV